MKISAPLWLEACFLNDWTYYYGGWRTLPLKLLWVDLLYLDLSLNRIVFKLFGLGFRLCWWWSNEYPW